MYGTNYLIRSYILVFDCSFFCSGLRVLLIKVFGGIIGGLLTAKVLRARIVLNPEIMVGKPVIKGLRLSEDHILNRLAHGETTEDLWQELPKLTNDDINACLLIWLFVYYEHIH